MSQEASLTGLFRCPCRTALPCFSIVLADINIKILMYCLVRMLYLCGQSLSFGLRSPIVDTLYLIVMPASTHENRTIFCIQNFVSH